uniref:Uncharacterized protein n=1 Tax=Opuntia streptacantha TaxID=393608 RepID=A0A7C9ALT8_OPUST
MALYRTCKHPLYMSRETYSCKLHCPEQNHLAISTIKPMKKTLPHSNPRTPTILSTTAANVYDKVAPQDQLVTHRVKIGILYTVPIRCLKIHIHFKGKFHPHGPSGCILGAPVTFDALVVRLST